MGRKNREAGTNSSRSTLNDRARKLLKSLVESYVKDGQPVGSKALARDSGLDLSPATIRNVMADLEDMGLVVSPHTSAGRIPTAKGYRLFVDCLLTVSPLGQQELTKIHAGLKGKETVDELVDSVSSLLSEFTRMAGVVMVPRRDYSALRRIEFLHLSDRRVLAVLVINEREVQNRVLSTVRDFSESELQQAANYLNDLFVGKDLQQVRAAILEEMTYAKQKMDDLMQLAIDMAGKIFDGVDGQPDLVLAGQTNLMNFAELSNLDKLRKLFEAFSEKRDILHLLDECVVAQSLQVFIGEESGFQVLDACSVITSPYQVDGKVLGVLGVIGPTRMHYERVIPLVDMTAKLVGTLLNSRD